MRTLSDSPGTVADPVSEKGLPTPTYEELPGLPAEEAVLYHHGGVALSPVSLTIAQSWLHFGASGTATSVPTRWAPPHRPVL